MSHRWCTATCTSAIQQPLIPLRLLQMTQMCVCPFSVLFCDRSLCVSQACLKLIVLEGAGISSVCSSRSTEFHFQKRADALSCICSSLYTHIFLIHSSVSRLTIESVLAVEIGTGVSLMIGFHSCGCAHSRGPARSYIHAIFSF